MANDDADRVWRLMDKIGFCMLVTRDGQRLRSRPMAAHPRREDGCIHFLTDADSGKEHEIEQNPYVNLAFADASGQSYVSVVGRASTRDDRALVHELWSLPAKAWWDSPEDPGIRVLTVVPEEAEFWDSPGRVVSYVSMLKAAVTGSRPKVGDHEKVFVVD